MEAAEQGDVTAGEREQIDRYLNLLKVMLTRTGFEPEITYHDLNTKRHHAAIRSTVNLAQRALATRSMRIMGVRQFNEQMRAEGVDCPVSAETMVGLQRLENLRECLEQVFQDGIRGDVLEAGVWRGGASIFMRGVLRAYGEGHRISWLADSFRGLPEPNEQLYPADAKSIFHNLPQLAIGRNEVEKNFVRFDLMDENVRFLEGLFADTLPDAPVGDLALLRLDGDMYESTIQTLDALYHKVTPGGFIVVDDYSNIEACRRATDEFREKLQIQDPVIEVDWNAVFWRKT